MRFANYKRKNHFTRKIFMILIVGLTVNTVLSQAAAEHKEFDADEFQEKFSISPNNIKTLDIPFQEGKRIEIIYTVQVEGELPVDIWFVNEDNYLLFKSGAQFLYFIDGSEQKTSLVKKIVSLTKHDNYKLVLTNYYNNQTAEITIKGEIRTFDDNIKESSSNFNQILLYSLIVVLIIFIIITIILRFKLHKSNRANIIEFNENSTKKFNKNKPKKKRNKNKNKYSKKKAKNKKSKETKDTKKETKTNPKSSGYCGYCGEAVSTPYCKHCGNKV